ncbi:IS3 family transposase (plasmid) [Alkalihalophilus sp. As8PL]|uniref:IS3 family transposase n=1 Tax=Alkalihalophilus sp. As8PL TaxID=3237103 RepID=A0AB39BN89_9BACI
MQENADVFSVVKMCFVLNVSRAGYYKWLERLDRPETEKEALRKELSQKIKKSYYESDGTYGSPRVHQDLLDWGYEVSQKTVAIIMRELGLKAILEEKYVVTTDSNHALPIAPNLLKRNFTTSAPDRIWVTDITYIRTLEGWVYLATVMDLFSRKIVGYCMDKEMKKDLTLAALKMAFSTRSPSENLIHHSDRGSQYCSKEYIDLLTSKQIQISMSRKGDPYDNACIESFHATIKKELIYRRRYTSRAEAIRSIHYYINNRYNTRRKHSSLGYCSPREFEDNYQFSKLQEVS